MSTVAWIWAALMAALVVAYLRGMRSDGLNGSNIVKIALIWVAIIGGGYLLVSWFTGMS